MRNHSQPWALLTAIVVSGAVSACTGGGGPLNDAMTTWDQPPSSVEGAASTREPAPGSREVTPPSEEGVGASAEPGPGAQGGGGVAAFDCAGVYSCAEPGQSKPDKITLTSSNGVCSVEGSDSALVLAADGSLLVKGNAVGTWQATPGGFTVTTEDGTATCTKQ